MMSPALDLCGATPALSPGSGALCRPRNPGILSSPVLSGEIPRRGTAYLQGVDYLLHSLPLEEYAAGIRGHAACGPADFGA